MIDHGRPGRIVIQVGAPFRLDYTVWALRRRAHNEVDRFDGRHYQRILPLADSPVEVTVWQPAASETQVLVAARRRTGPVGDVAVAAAGQVVERMLGLAADLGAFYEVADRDARLRPLALRFRGMRPPCFPTVFEAVVNAVACQQLSLDVGIHLLNRLARRFGPVITGNGPGEQHGFPVPARLAAADPAELRALGYSGAKARSITAIATQVAAGDLDLEALRGLDDDSALKILLGLPGIGRWSAEYVLLRGLARYHVLPGDDVGAQRGLHRRFKLPDDAGYDAVAGLARHWWPCAGLVYFHLLLDSLAVRGDLDDLGDAGVVTCRRRPGDPDRRGGPRR